MTVPLIKVRDKLDGSVHVVGSDVHDVLLVNDDGSISYMNLQNGEGTGPESSYEFVTEFDGCWTTIPWVARSDSDDRDTERLEEIRRRQNKWDESPFGTYPDENSQAFIAEQLEMSWLASQVPFLLSQLDAANQTIAELQQRIRDAKRYVAPCDGMCHFATGATELLCGREAEPYKLPNHSWFPRKKK